MSIQNAAQQFSHAMTYLVMKYVVSGEEFIPQNELEAISDAHEAYAAMEAFSLSVVAYAQTDVLSKMAWQMVPGDSSEEWESLMQQILGIFEVVKDFSCIIDSDEDEDEDPVFEYTADKEHLAACFSL